MTTPQAGVALSTNLGATNDGTAQWSHGAPSAAPSRAPAGSAAVPLPALIAAGRPVLVHDYRGDWLGWTRMVPDVTDVTDEPCHVACIDPLYSGRKRHAVYGVPWRALAQPRN